MSWSTGKDSAYALHVARDQLDIVMNLRCTKGCEERG
jgi:diphthamide synthase (EF-2-diphthine--ammonia ligase)